MSGSLHCSRNSWCKRFADHPGACRRKASRKDMERMFGDLTPAELELRRRLGGG
jgi:hypothetical protein